MLIDNNVAAVVGRIFDVYAAGKSVLMIATDLVKEGVAAPGDNEWAVNTIIGWAAKESGIFRNRLHKGERVWNKNRYLKPPLKQAGALRVTIYRRSRRYGLFLTSALCR